MGAVEVYLVTVEDYESATIIGAYSTEEAAQAVAAATDVLEYGRMGPSIVRLEVDPPTPTPMWPDGEPAPRTPRPEPRPNLG